MRARGANIYGRLVGCTEYRGRNEDSYNVLSVRRADTAPDGYLPFEISGEGEYAIIKAENGKLVKRLVESAPSVNTYSKSLLARGIIERGKMGELNTMLSVSAELAFYWNSFTEFDDTDPAWPMMSSAVREGIGMTEEDWQGLLEEAKV